MKQWFHLILAVGFIAGLALPTFGSLGHVPKNQLINENRRFATLPAISDDPAVWHDYCHQLETYYDDHFGFRQSLIALNLMIQHMLFSAELGPDVLRGRDGWLYLKRDRTIDLLDDHLGLVRFNERELKDFQTRLEERHDWLAARRIQYLFVIAPDKETVYPEFLPAWLKPATPTRLDQFFEYMRLHSLVDALDLRPVFQQAKAQGALYYQTDPHWNALGASVAAEAIIASVASHLPGLAPFDRAELNIQSQPGAGGDLLRMAGESGGVESNRYVFLPGPNLPKLEFSTPETNQMGWAQMMNTPVPEYQTVTTINPRSSREVVIFGDSFGVTLQPFLGLHFGKVIYLRRAFDRTSVKQLHPDLVIDEVVERHFR